MTNYAILIGDNFGVAQTIGLREALSRLGFAQCTSVACAPALSRLLVLQRIEHNFNAALTREQAALPAGSVRFAVVPVGTSISTRTVLARQFDGVLVEPVDEIVLCNALAAQRFDTLVPSDGKSLRAKVLELACDDAVAARHLLQMISDTNRATLTLLCDSVEAESWDVAGSAAHRITGSARMLDCRTLIALLIRLEAVARDRDTLLAKALLPLVVNALESLDLSVQKALGPVGV
jgi:HPt (histidine-containing phosphotransfer) domain-containing protein